MAVAGRAAPTLPDPGRRLLGAGEARKGQGHGTLELLQPDRRAAVLHGRALVGGRGTRDRRGRRHLHAAHHRRERRHARARPDAGNARHRCAAPPVQGCFAELARLSGRLTLPDDARRLVERSSHPEVLAAVIARGPAWAQAWQAQRHGGEVAKQGGGLALYDPHRAWSEQKVRPVPLRLGELPLEIAVEGLVSPLTGRPLPEVRLTEGGRAPLLPVPARWLPGVADETRAKVKGQLIEIAGRRLIYGTDGLQRMPA